MRAVITERDIPVSGRLAVPKGALVTPAAREAAKIRGVEIVEVADEALPQPDAGKTVAIGADHGGFALKQILLGVLHDLDLHAKDVGVFDGRTADYPDIARAVAELVATGTAARGVIIDGAGIGSAMAANKIPGIRAALCYDKSSARNSREHNNANVLTLGGRLLTATQAEDVLRTWLATPFAGGRHAARVDKIGEIEKAYRQWTPKS